MKLPVTGTINNTHSYELRSCYFPLEQHDKYPLEIFYKGKHLITLFYDYKINAQRAIQTLKADHVSFISNELKSPIWRLEAFKTWLDDHNVEIKR